MDFDYELPLRGNRSDNSFQNYQKTQFLTNLYPITLDSEMRVYQYKLTLPEEVENDSREVYEEVIRESKVQLRKLVGFLSYSGQQIWGDKKCDLTTDLNIAKFKINEKKFAIRPTIKLVKELSLLNMDEPESRPALLQIINTNIKTRLDMLNMHDLGNNGEYYKNSQIKNEIIGNMNLSVLRGFKLTVQVRNNNLYLMIDICSKVRQAKDFLEMSEKAKNDFAGQVIISGYGNLKTYKVIGFSEEKTPESFTSKLIKGKKLTYIEYYFEKYGLVVKDKKQPMLRVSGGQKRILNKETKQFQTHQDIVHVIPQFVYLTGLTEEQRADRAAMRAIEPFTRLTPEMRVFELNKFMEEFNTTSGMFRVTDTKNPVKVDGYYLKMPIINFSGQKEIKPNEQGEFKTRAELHSIEQLTDILFVYSKGRSGSQDDDEIDKDIELLTKSALQFGIKIRNSSKGLLRVSGQNVNIWKQEIKEQLDKNGSPQIIVVFLNDREDFYDELKRFLYSECTCPSQFVQRKSLRNFKTSRTIAGYINVQISLKIGGVPWKVQKSHPYFADKKVMYGGISISNKNGKSVLGFVGTTNNQCTRIFNDFRTDLRRKEQIPMATMEQIFIKWAKKYYLNSGSRPDIIIIYREGLSEFQAKIQLPMSDIPAIKKMIEKIGVSTKCPGYDPEVIIVLANKKINTRIFQFGNPYFDLKIQNPQRHPHIQIKNADSGALVIEPLSSGLYDFHLVPQYVPSGTSTPTLFRVGYEKSRMPQQALISFTFDQCFNYYNWMGAVRVPACLQNANKLATLVSDKCLEKPLDSELQEQFHFM